MRRELYSPPYQRLAEIMRDARVNAGMTQAQLAEATSRTQAYVSKFEAGQLRLDVIDFVLFARTLKLDPAQLLAEVESDIVSDVSAPDPKNLPRGRKRTKM